MKSILYKLIPLTVLAGLAVPLWAGATAEVLVRPSSSVPGAEVTLADIGSVKSSDRNLAARLQGVTICAAPLAGRSQSISRAQIIAALRKRGLSDSVSLLSPPQVTVTRPSLVVKGQTLFEVVRKLTLEAGLKGAAVEVEPVRLPADQVVPSGSVEVRVSAAAPKVRKGRNTVPVEILVDGKRYRSVQVSVTARVFGRALVATQAIGRNEPLTAVNTVVQDCETTNVFEDVIDALPPSDAIASVPIAQGAQIRRKWISEPAVIKAGDVVIVSVVGESTRVSEKGTAAGDGRPGDRIKVRLSGGAREVRGTVVGPGLVEIQIGRRS
ncbi:MAG: flagellar basal body P-ring formation chaperone FlgA [Armatimonadota bacterium]|nr:flagellar basal body P-ring formation chaperone FlgA [Armatimonadota bacterium]